MAEACNKRTEERGEEERCERRRKEDERETEISRAERKDKAGAAEGKRRGGKRRTYDWIESGEDTENVGAEEVKPSEIHHDVEESASGSALTTKKGTEKAIVSFDSPPAREEIRTESKRYVCVPLGRGP